MGQIHCPYRCGCAANRCVLGRLDRLVPILFSNDAVIIDNPAARNSGGEAVINARRMDAPSAAIEPRPDREGLRQTQVHDRA